MENKINVAELLKDCPKGMELDCTIWDNVVLAHVDVNSKYPIWIKKMEGEIEFLTENGCFNFDCSAKCVIFPKGKTTWEGFHKPFEDGDIVAFDGPHLQICIFRDKKENNTLSDCYLMLDGDELYLEDGMYYVTRFATTEEKAKLFDAIKSHGYKWNPETKTLEKGIQPKFKVGDRIKYRSGEIVYRIVKITEDSYVLDNLCSIPISIEHVYNLVPAKFDIATLKPFESRVLARSDDKDRWKPAIFGGCARNRYNEIEYFYALGGTCWRNCIPYEGNEHLLGTTHDCDEFYKNWE